MNTMLTRMVVLGVAIGITVPVCPTTGETSRTENSSLMRNTTAGGIRKITITIDGGKPVELTFKGGQELGCGGTVVFKSLNQSKEVESGQSERFAFTPYQAGEIPFTCGMEMYYDKVVVK